MKAYWPAVGLGTGAFVSGLVATLATRRSPQHLIRPNYAGRPTPVVLGLLMSLGVIAGSYLGAEGARSTPDPAPIAVAMTTGLFVWALTIVGALDDHFGRNARGIGGHLRSLVKGRPTTGILKLVVGVGVAVLVALHLADDPVRVVGIAVLVALCTNLWNALDVVPGRALKWAAAALIPIVAVAWSRPSAPVLAATLGAVLALVPFDLRERGMLGDAGSNPLGFLVGLGLAVVLPTWAVLAAAAVALLLQLAAETVTLSRLIASVPPLRWFDGLGRVKAETEAQPPGTRPRF